MSTANLKDDEQQKKSVRDSILNLPYKEIKERRQAKADYNFYKGKSENYKAAAEKKDYVKLGQNWIVNDNDDYKPTQEIRNKVKPLLRKVARWMFGKKPTIVIKADDSTDDNKAMAEELRKFIEDVFEENNMWSNTKKAYLDASIKKRTLLRIEANPGEAINIKYENLDDFYYKEKNNKLIEAKFFQEDEGNAFKEDESEYIYYLHTYYYQPVKEEKKDTEGNIISSNIVDYQLHYKRETFKSAEKQESKTIDTVVNISNTMPCWLIKNSGELNSEFGESDVTDIRDAQMQYNKRISDFADALRFQMFGTETVIDGKEEDVNNFNVVPGAIHAVHTTDEAMEKGKQAKIEHQEYNMGNVEAVNSYLDRCDSDMREILDIPKVSDLNNIPSAKAMKYLFNDLIAKCDEKFTDDWEDTLLSLIDYIIEVGEECYPGIFNPAWRELPCTITIKRNIPLQDDIDEKKDTAMKEVTANVRSRRGYIKEFSNEEDSEREFKDICEEEKMLNQAATSDEYTDGVKDDLNNQE